jgi:hypothetical protein
MPFFSHSRGRRALLLATLAVGAALPALAAGPTLLNVSYDVSPRVLQGLQHRLRRALEEDHRRGHHAEPEPWRLQPPGAQRGRRAGSRCHHDEPAQRHRHPVRARQAGAAGLGQAAALQQRAHHVGVGDPGAQGQPEEDRRLERPGPPRHRRHHPQPQDQRQRPLHLPGGLGRGHQVGPEPRRRQGAGDAHLRQRAGARRRRPRRHHHLRAAQPGRCAGHLRKRGAADHQGVRRQLRGGLPQPHHPGREPGERGRQGGGQEAARASRPRPTCSSCTPTRARRSPPGTTCARAATRCWPGTPSSSPSSTPSRWTRCSAAGPRRRRSTSTTAPLYDQVIAAAKAR